MIAAGPARSTAASDGGHVYRTDLLDHGRTMLAVCHPNPDDDEPEAQIADAIADLLHLAASLNVDPEAALDHARRYYTSDLEGPLP